MALRLIQLQTPGGGRWVAALEQGGRAVRLAGVESVYALAMSAIADGVSLADAAARRRTQDTMMLSSDDNGVRLLAPIDHPDPAHLHLTGTGLTHLGSAESRDKMHALAAAGGAQTDSMRIFLQGIQGGKPAAGAVGCQPEWFYKGNGYSVAATDQDLPVPAFALDGGEESEIAGIYVIDPDGNARRLGFCLANEFSDHVTERQNYLWLAHSKLRQAALGAELLTGPLPANVQGTSALRRDGAAIWQKPFLSGEDNMSHSVANLEHHHFKYDLFRKPGDVHVHFFGCATLSFADGVKTQAGDVFEIRADAFKLPLRNRMSAAAPHEFSVWPL
ncbi:MAG: FAH family protein [Pseudomonadota bacterium]|nr:FAH family protein [Pseudomonadota bacterium]